MKGSNTGTALKQIRHVAEIAWHAYAPYRGHILLLTVLSFIGGIIEGVGINAVIPLLSLVLGIQNAATDTISRLLKILFALLHIPFFPRYLLALIVALFLLKAVVSFCISYVQIRITSEYDRSIRSRLFSKVLRSSWPYLLTQKLGNIESILMIDAPMTTSLLVKISAMITLVSNVIMYFGVALSISPVVTGATFLVGGITFLVMRPVAWRVHHFSKERAESYGETLHHVSEHVSGLKNVKAFNVEMPAIERGNQYFNSITRLGIRIQLLQQIAAQVIPPVGVIYIAVILTLAFKTPFITLAALPAILYLIYRIFSYVQQMQVNMHSMVEYIPHLERAVQFEISTSSTQEKTTGTRPFAFQRELTFNDVSFQYGTGKKVLDRVSFSIAKGSMVGIVGPSGAGKTTCVDMILRLLEPTGGAILLDGVPSTETSLSQWRKNISYVSQDFFLIHGTIRENICFYDESITDDDIWLAAKQAHIDEFISSCPDGLDTEVGDRGVRLSAGQRQRITIARALARKPKILIFDEATSSLDNESEAHIKGVIDELKGKVTIIAIAHRLSTILHSDQLIVLQEGRVVETGSPHNLLSDTSSYFYKVYTISQ